MYKLTRRHQMKNMCKNYYPKLDNRYKAVRRLL